MESEPRPQGLVGERRANICHTPWPSAIDKQAEQQDELSLSYGPSEMAQWVKHLLCKPEHLSSIPRTHW